MVYPVPFFILLVSLPLFSSIRDGKLNKQVTGFAEFCQGRSWGIYLFAVPIMILNTLGSFLDQNISRMFLIVAFIFGFIVYSNPGFGEAIDAQRRKVLTITIVTTIALVLIILIGDFEMEGLEMLVFGPLLGIETWLWILTFLSAARNKLNYKNRFLAYANEGSYPFYIHTRQS